MATKALKELSKDQSEQLIQTLKNRFEQHMDRHQGLEWQLIQERLEADMSKLWSLHEMERTGGEPDVIVLDKGVDSYTYYDCSAESPAGRRSLCYDKVARESRKKFPPESSVEELADQMGVQILNEEQYLELQMFGPFDTKTSSWISTPENIRKNGGALFCDHRFGQVFVYHNGADSYYTARGFRSLLLI